VGCPVRSADPLKSHSRSLNHLNLRDMEMRHPYLSESASKALEKGSRRCLQVRRQIRSRLRASQLVRRHDGHHFVISHTLTPGLFFPVLQRSVVAAVSAITTGLTHPISLLSISQFFVTRSDSIFDLPPSIPYLITGLRPWVYIHAGAG
jgi:hypothetical protein